MTPSLAKDNDVPALTLTKVPNDLGGIAGHDPGIAPSGLTERAGYDYFFHLVEPPGERAVPRVGALVAGHGEKPPKPW